MHGYQSFLLQDLTEALPRISNSIKSGDFNEFDVGVRDASGAVCALTESAAQVCIDELVILCTHFSHRPLSCDNHITRVLSLNPARSCVPDGCFEPHMAQKKTQLYLDLF